MRKIIATLLFALLATPAFAQSLEQPGAKERTAQSYAAHAWPEAGPDRTGLHPATITAAGFQRTQVRVDPRSGLATITYAALGRDGKPLAKTNAALVHVQVHASAAAAREALLARLTAVQAKLNREEALGEVAYGNRVAGGLSYLVGAVGNVSYVVRALAKTDVEPLAAAAARQAAAAPVREDGQSVAPRVLACEIAPAQVGRPAALSLDFDPGAAKAAHVAFECSNGASVIATKTGYELYTSKPGPVTVKVFACSKLLGVGTLTVKTEAAPRD